VIRRGFWLAVGAALGVSGYRRVSRLARSLQPASAGTQLTPAGPRLVSRRPAVTGRRVLAGAARAGRSTAEGVAFARDVRDGMAEYLDRQARQTGRTLESQQGRRPSPGRQRRAAP
jgi:hypothetical protein